MKNLNVIIIEDNDDDVVLLLRKLKNGGFNVNYVQVLEEHELRRELENSEWDVIISDYRLPKFNGINALKVYKEYNIDIPFIIVSGTIGEELAVQAMKEGAHDYLMKVKLERLVPAIERELRDAGFRRENQQAQKALQESEERYRQLVEMSPDGIFIIHEDKIVYANNSAARIMKTSESWKLIGLETSIIFDDGCIVDELLSPPNQGEQVTMKECKLKALNGTTIHAEINTVPIKFSGNSVLQIIFRDISRRKLAEEELLKLSKAVIQSPVAIVITDTRGIIEYSNPKFEEQSGFSFEEIRGKELRVMKEGTLDKKEHDNLWSDIGGGEEWRGEVENVRKNGEHYWENVSISPIKKTDGKITHYVVIKEEITDRKRMERELIDAKEAAVKSDNLKSEFLAQMSHEIRTPINVLLSFSEMVCAEVEQTASDDLKESFRMIDKAGRRIIRTIDLLLNMSEIQTNSYDYISKAINIHNDILKPIVPEFISLADQKELDFILNLETEDPIVVADEYSLTQIMSNLINNAINYTEKGKVEINVKKDPIGNTIVEVNDTGIGISDEYLPNLFIPFTQESRGYTRKFEGNGLGLSLVQNYCEMNNADISVESKKGVGSKFTIKFPAI